MSANVRRRWVSACLAVAVLLIVLGVWWWLRGTREEDVPPGFDGASDQLKQTVIVPTLDSPLPDGKSAIWCASFQLAWNRLREVAKEPIRLAEAQPLADRLNRADQTEADVGPDAVYAAAGLVKDGIVEQIQTQMGRQFPDVPRPHSRSRPMGRSLTPTSRHPRSSTTPISRTTSASSSPIRRGGGCRSCRSASERRT